MLTEIPSTAIEKENAYGSQNISQLYKIGNFTWYMLIRIIYICLSYPTNMFSSWSQTAEYVIII